MKENFESFSREYPTRKVRLTLMVDPSIRDELKRQARTVGVSASAYVSVLVSERSSGWQKEKVKEDMTMFE